MDYKNILNILVALFNLIFGVIIFVRAQKRAVHFYFSFISFGIAAWALCMTAFRLVDVQGPALIWARFLYVPPIFIVTMFLMFTYVFPNKPLNFAPKIHGSIFLISLIMTSLVLLPGGVIQNVIVPSHPEEEEKIIFGTAYPLYFLMILSYFCWSFLRLHRKQKHANGLRKIQIQFVLYGTFISANLGMVTNLILPTFGVFDFNWMGPVFTIIMVATIGYAIVRHRLMDIRSPLSKNLAYSFLLIGTFSGYSGFLLLTDKYIEETLGESSGIIIVSLLLAIGFEPIKRFIEKTTNRIFYKKLYDPQKFLTELNRGIHSIIDLNKILSSIKNIVMAHFNLERMGIYLIDEKLLQYTPKEQSGLLDIHPISLQNPMIQSLEKNGTLIYESLLDQTNKTANDDEVLEEMEQRGISLITPLYSEKKLIGLYFFGPKKSGDYFSGLDLQIVEIICAQTGTTIENARLYQQVNFQMEELKKTQMQQLIQAAKLTSIGELATSVAHEINNPLTGILGFANLLLKGMDDKDPKKRDVKVIESEALRTRTIVHSLLDFARQREPRREKADMNEVLKATLVLIRHQAELSNVELIEQYKEPLPSISIDIDQMKQVFINLIKNAFDAMPNGGKLYIKTNVIFVRKALEEKTEEMSNETSQTLEITFSDTGTGMTPEVMNRIFEPFYTTKGEKLGTGLGLPVSYGIIERHGGQIEVQSALGKGTTFKIKCPAS